LFVVSDWPTSRIKRKTQNLYDLQPYKTILSHLASQEGNKCINKKLQNVIDLWF